MRMQFPEGDGPHDPEWFRPLYDVWRAVPAVAPFDRFDPDDFLVMGRVLRGPQPDITLYKHRYTRRYLNLDAAGLAYRYAGPPLESFRSGEYRRQDLTAALRALGLGELPHLKVASRPGAAGGRTAHSGGADGSR
ncbi:MAG: hypothetical protein JWO77_2624 [Ilumatobacteraceae bacterium]|nr:hypothetical protein [Ilumatobacteraceae bacterium]